MSAVPPHPSPAVPSPSPTVPSPSPAVVAFVPLKALATAKSRLGPTLAPPQRRRLAARMATAVCEACLASPAVERVVLLAGDEDAAGVIADHPVTVRRSPAPGLLAAVADADRAYADAAATLVVAADLWQVSAAELTALVAAAARRDPTVVVAPTVDGGTGALLRRPPTIIPPAFGPNSAAAHRRAAQQTGASVVGWWSPRLGYDIDEPADLDHVRTLRGPGWPVGCPSSDVEGG